MPELVLREIKPGDKITRFSLGSAEYAPLKAFLKKQAKSYHQQNLTKTYVLADREDARVFGYVSLVCSQVDLEFKKPVEGFPYHYPCVKIVRLAIDQELKGQQLGTKLVNWSISIAKEKVMQHVGCRFIVVDSKPSAIPFYEKCGFTLLDTQTNRNADHPLLYIDLHKI